jgi:sRNA-binding protein
MIEVLKQRWPELFGVKNQPIALGSYEAIRDALETPEEDHRALRKTIGKHCATLHYVRAVAAGVDRLGIDGITSPVSEAHRAAANVLREQMEGKIQFRRKKRKDKEKAAKLEAEPSEAAIYAALTRPSAPAPVVIVKKRRMVVQP